MRAALLLLLSMLLAGVVLSDAPPPQRVRGAVVDENGPVACARVRFQGDRRSTITDDDGRFELRADLQRPSVTAWKSGYAIASADSRRQPLKLSLIPLPTEDNPDYEWIDPASNPKQPNNCANCHKEIHAEWAGSAHARAAENRRLGNLVGGTDWHGQRSKTWSVKDEHPLGTGVCAGCHAPTFQDPMLKYDLTRVAGVAARGVHCDYCHKIVDAPTDKLGTRFGRDGLRLLRPSQGAQLFFGPLDDAVRAGERFGHLPLYKESRYCASCHEGVIFGVRVYSTYSEWLESPARKQGQQCQDCHMKPTGRMTNIAPGKGGIERDPKTLASHVLPGGQADMLKQCLIMKVDWRTQNGGVKVNVQLAAANVGHRVPTGFIDRHLLLVVDGLDKNGKAVALKGGPTLPVAAGKDLAGRPGALFARQLASAKARPVPFWLADDESTDTRLAPGKPQERQFTFGPDLKRARLRLVYRRFWEDVAKAKGWPDNEIVIIDRVTKPSRE